MKAERKKDQRPSHAERPARGGRTPNPANDDRRERRNHYRDRDDGPTPVGFGDDIPAFMLIQAKA